MTDHDNKAFFSAVLKAVACTRNHNTDGSGYATGVLAPTARIREFEKETGGRPLTPAETEQVLGWLESTFRTKQTPDEERAYYLARVAEASGPVPAPLGAFA
ncbi:hypothetical protein [Streptomyces sp. NPDC051567]|uniref:hypothetical protein n=1 Tax=Streptomyces sp. NPDC051567 TaxID=3365660 RepID=UPI00379A2C19